MPDSTFVEEQLAGSTTDLTTVIVEAYNTVQQDKDVVVLEGGASLREGYAVGLATAKVTRMLGAPVMGGSSWWRLVMVWASQRKCGNRAT